MAFEVFGDVLVGLGVVVALAVGTRGEQAGPLLRPVVFVVALIVIAALGDAYLEEVGIVEHGCAGGVASAGVAKDAGAIDVDEGILCGQLLHACDLIGNGVVAEIGVIGLVEALGAQVGSHAVNAHDNEAQLC